MSPIIPETMASIALEMVHGTFSGGTCADVWKRKRPQDKGFGYDEHHPATAGEIVYVDVEDVEQLLRSTDERVFKLHELRAA